MAIFVDGREIPSLLPQAQQQVVPIQQVAIPVMNALGVTPQSMLSGIQAMMPYVQQIWAPYQGAISGMLSYLPQGGRRNVLDTQGRQQALNPGQAQDQGQAGINWNLIKEAFSHPQATPATIKFMLDTLLQVLSAQQKKAAVIQKAFASQLDAINQEMKQLMDLYPTTGGPMRTNIEARMRQLQEEAKQLREQMGALVSPQIPLQQQQGHSGNKTALPAPGQGNETITIGPYGQRRRQQPALPDLSEGFIMP